MDTEFLERINSEIINITRQRSSNGLVCYGNINFIDSLVWIYQNYFLKETKIFTSEYYPYPDGVICNLEILERYTPDKNEVIIFIYADFIFKDFNKKRLADMVDKTWVNSSDIT